MTDIHQMLDDAVSRRTFLARMSAAGLGALSLPLLTGCNGNTSSNNINSSVGNSLGFTGVPGRNANEVVLNYALTLEIAEADLYRQALNRASGLALGTQLDTRLPTPGTTGNYKLTLTAGGLDSNTAAAAFLYLTQFAYTEATHRDYLFAILTGLGAPLAQANVKGYQFPNNEPGADLRTILTTLYSIEETGQRAYLGSVPTLTDNGMAQIAGAIHSTEARHAAALAYTLGKDPGPAPGVAATADVSVTGQTYPHPNTFEYASAPSDVLTAVSTAYFVK